MHFTKAACQLQFRGYFLTKYHLIELKSNTEYDADKNNKTVCVISLIVFTDKYKYSQAFSLISTIGTVKMAQNCPK